MKRYFTPILMISAKWQFGALLAAILFMGMPGPADAGTKAGTYNACKAAILQEFGESPVEFGKFKRNVTVSVGAAQYEPGVLDIDHLMRLADESVYASKQGGRNRVTINPGLGDERKTA